MNSHTCGREPAALSPLGQVLDLAGELHRALERFLQILAEVLETRRAFISLRNPDTGRFTLRASLGDVAGEAEAVTRDWEAADPAWRQTAAFQIAAPGQAAVLFQGNPSLRRQEAAWLGAPLVWLGEIQGIFCVDRIFADPVAVTEDLRVLGVLAPLAAHLAGLGREMSRRWVLGGQEAQVLKEELTRRWRLVLVGRSPEVQELARLAPRAAASWRPVLLAGEAGTGKHWLARLLHALGPQPHQPFTVWPAEPTASNLGDAQAGSGAFSPPAAGSLFLPEAAHLPPDGQAQLSRILAAQEAGAIAAASTQNLRILAATTQDLGKSAAEGRFRADLLRQLSAFSFFLPPLRRRSQDIPLLLEGFLNLAAQDYGRALAFSPQAMELCTLYGWPGNLLEMANLVERLAVSVPHPVFEVRDLPGHLLTGALRDAGPALPSQSRLKELERREVVAALERHRWVQSQAAAELGLTLRQIGYRVKQFGLTGLVKSRRGRSAAAKE